jgi:hypothetical protein
MRHHGFRNYTSLLFGKKILKFFEFGADSQGREDYFSALLGR